MQFGMYPWCGARSGSQNEGVIFKPKPLQVYNMLIKFIEVTRRERRDQPPWKCQWRQTRRAVLTFLSLSTSRLAPYSFTLVSTRLNSLGHIARPFFDVLMGPWSKVVHYIGNRVPFETCALSRSLSLSLSPPPPTSQSKRLLLWGCSC